MKSSKGFTMVEMVIGLLLVGMIIMVAMSFMVLQSRYGRTSTGQRSAREVVALALNMIARDVRQAGFGLGDTLTDSSTGPSYVIDSANLAILPDTEEVQTWDDGSTHRCYTRLFIQYGMYLSPDPTTVPNVFGAPVPATPVPPGDARFSKPGAITAYPFTAISPELSLASGSDFVKGSLNDSQIGGLIGYKFDVATNRQRTLLLTYDAGGPRYDTASTTESNTYYVPAVVYTYHGSPDYEIRRNGVSLTAGRFDMRITGFCVQATFYDSTMAPPQEIQVPQALGTKKFETFVSPTRPNLRDLRNMIVTVRYKIRQAAAGTDPALEWARAPEFKKTMVVAPRAIVTQAALTQQTPLANPTDF